MNKRVEKFYIKWKKNSEKCLNIRKKNFKLSKWEYTLLLNEPNIDILMHFRNGSRELQLFRFGSVQWILSDMKIDWARTISKDSEHDLNNTIRL